MAENITIKCKSVDSKGLFMSFENGNKSNDAEYIERKVLNKFLDECIRFESDALEYAMFAENVKDFIKRGIEEHIRAADVAPVVHAHWINMQYEDGMARCSVCGETYDCTEEMFDGFARFYHYCPSCGAIMDGGGDEIKSRGEADGTG